LYISKKNVVKVCQINSAHYQIGYLIQNGWSKI